MIERVPIHFRRAITLAGLAVVEVTTRTISELSLSTLLSDPLGPALVSILSQKGDILGKFGVAVDALLVFYIAYLAVPTLLHPVLPGEDSHPVLRVVFAGLVSLKALLTSLEAPVADRWLLLLLVVLLIALWVRLGDKTASEAGPSRVFFVLHIGILAIIIEQGIEILSDLYPLPELALAVVFVGYIGYSIIEEGGIPNERYESLTGESSFLWAARFSFRMSALESDEKMSIDLGRDIWPLYMFWAVLIGVASLTSMVSVGAVPRTTLGWPAAPIAGWIGFSVPLPLVGALLFSLWYWVRVSKRLPFLYKHIIEHGTVSDAEILEEGTQFGYVVDDDGNTWQSVDHDALTDDSSWVTPVGDNNIAGDNQDVVVPLTSRYDESAYTRDYHPELDFEDTPIGTTPVTRPVGVLFPAALLVLAAAVHPGTGLGGANDIRFAVLTVLGAMGVVGAVAWTLSREPQPPISDLVAIPGGFLVIEAATWVAFDLLPAIVNPGLANSGIVAPAEVGLDVIFFPTYIIPIIFASFQGFVDTSRRFFFISVVTFLVSLGYPFGRFLLNSPFPTLAYLLFLGVSSLWILSLRRRIDRVGQPA